ncbi:MAG: right-handed parallel beta-helix repeat-containing protein [Sedimentisphaerales bacterium]|nr:right-handed parallel beta-helix repeat-containing protein [Sedimentisphaerales bacterium]
MQCKENHIRPLLCALFLLAVSCTIVTGKVIYVDGDAVAEFDGSSWPFAFRTFQEAIAQVRPGDEIRVAEGIYRPDRWPTMSGRAGGGSRSVEITASGDRADTFELVNGVTFKGGYAGYGEPYPDVRDFNLYQTILSGDLEGNDVEIISPEDLLSEPNRSENSYHVVTGSGTTILDGFTITGGNANESSNSKGGGLYNRYGVVEVINCKFVANSAKSDGGAIYNELSNTSLTRCIFIGNSAGNDGGGLYNYKSNPNLTNCTFTENSAADCGGGIFNYESDLSLDNCTFSANSAQDGGGMHNNRSSPNINNCTFSENSARYGGGVYNYDSVPVLRRCVLQGNSAADYGGGMYNYGSGLTLSNCIFSGNQARLYGAGMSCNNSDSTLTNCTFSGNSAPDGSSLACNSRGSRSTVVLVNCILWDEGNEIWNNDNSSLTISYSDIRGWSRIGNIKADPLFTDPNGPDNIPGTEDDDLRLAPLSPCIDSGDPNYVSEVNATDFEGNPRVISNRVDMGAYEFLAVIYVDNKGSDDIGQNDLLEDGSKAHPFHTIQEAINIAKDDQTVLVRPGVYSKIDFMGKAITIAGTDGAAVIEAWSVNEWLNVEKEDAVTFHTGEGPDSVLKNFIIRNSNTAISLNYGSSPTIRNLTIVDNDFGIAAYENSNPDISNCIFFDNKDGDLFQCQARYCCLVDKAQGQGNINVDPLFVDPAGGDYHLKSEGWRWNVNSETWAYDNITSLCIDAGDPASPLGNEPMSVPRDPNNEYGINLRINMGAYGGTCQASMPPLNWSIPQYETDPPEPNPTQWARDGRPKKIYGGGGAFDYWVHMTAAEATDASGPVQYFFECTTEPGFSSGWQISKDHMVPVGQGRQAHCFRVKARDQFGNETEWSEELPTD